MIMRPFFFIILFLILPKSSYSVEPITIALVGAAATGTVTFMVQWWYQDPYAIENSRKQSVLLQNAIDQQQQETNHARQLAAREAEYFLCKLNAKSDLAIPDECRKIAEFYIALGGQQAYSKIINT